MEGMWGTLAVLGLFAAGLAQLTAAVLCFSLSPGRGLASLIIPGYLFVGIKQHRLYRPVIGLWIAGLLAITASTVALS